MANLIKTKKHFVLSLIKSLLNKNVERRNKLDKPKSIPI